MSEMKSGDVRRFFDLLGSIFCGVFVGLVFGGMISTSKVVDAFVAFPFSIGACVYIFSVFPRFYWHFVGTKFLYGYFNFILISVSNVSLIIFATFMLHLLIPSNKVFLSFQEFFMLNYLSVLPMAFFWILGIITTWKFSKRKTLLR
jgi:hypothetical protein